MSKQAKGRIYQTIEKKETENGRTIKGETMGSSVARGFLKGFQGITAQNVYPLRFSTNKGNNTAAAVKRHICLIWRVCITVCWSYRCRTS